MADTPFHDWSKKALPNPDVHLGILQDRSSTDVSILDQATTPMVPGFYYERGLHVDGYENLEEVSSLGFGQIHAKHYPNDSAALLHHVDFDHHHYQKSPGSAGWIYCDISRSQLAY